MMRYLKVFSFALAVFLATCSISMAGLFTFDISGRPGWSNPDFYIYLVDVSPTGQITILNDSGITQYSRRGEINWRLQGIDGDLASDHEGNTFVLVDNCTLFSYDQYGRERWTDKIANASPGGLGLATDSDDNVYVLCEKYSGDTASDTTHIITKCSPNGERLWQQTVKTQFESVNLDLFVESDGSSYLLSVAWDYQGNTYSVLFAFDSSGNNLWKIESNRCDFGALAGNRSSAIYVLESCEEGEKLVMYGPNGTEQWRRDFADNLSMGYLAITPDGGPIVLGVDTSSGDERENHIIRYDTSGQTIFDVSYKYLIGGIGWPTVDRFGNIYTIAGICDEISASDECISSHTELQKFDSSGNRRWNTEFGASGVMSLDSNEDAIYANYGVSEGIFLSPSLWPSSDDDATDDDIVSAGGGGDNSGCGC